MINLSYGTDSVQGSTVDPLAYAVENAWKHGIVVVAAGGNDGEPAKTLADPAYDPHVLAVGAMDDAGTVSAADDTVPGVVDPRHRRPARRRRRARRLGARPARPRRHWRTRQNPQARVGDRFARASGTSQATAVAAGEAALILQQYPGLTPDQVKQLMMTTASGILSTLPIFGGSGLVNLRAVLTNPLERAAQDRRRPARLAARPRLGLGHRFAGEARAAASTSATGTSRAAAARSTSSAGPGAATPGPGRPPAATPGTAASWRGQRMTGDAGRTAAWPTDHLAERRLDRRQLDVGRLDRPQLARRLLVGHARWADDAWSAQHAGGRGLVGQHAGQWHGLVLTRRGAATEASALTRTGEQSGVGLNVPPRSAVVAGRR